MMTDDFGIGPARQNNPLDPALDQAMRTLSGEPDVKGILILVFSDDHESPAGSSVSLNMTGQLPAPEILTKCLSDLLTRLAQKPQGAR